MDDKPLESIPAEKSGEIVEDKSISVRGHLFTPVYLTGKKPTVVKLSQREARFCAKFIKHGNLDLACQEIGLDPDRGKRFLARRGVKAYVLQKVEEAALATGTDADNNLSWLRRVRDGDEEVSKEQMDAAKVIAKMFRPASGPISVKMQQNNFTGGSNATVPSPYANMGLEQIGAEMKERVNAIEGRHSGTA